MATLLFDAPRSDATAIGEGTVIAGRYRVRKLLGKGGFGAVFLAQHTGTGQDMAVKVLSGGDVEDALALKRFFLEARVTAGLRQVHTVRVFDFGQDDTGLIYLAMELLMGRSLQHTLRDRFKAGTVFTEREVLTIADAVLRSLGEAHGAGLVHRDLKPDNIWLHQVDEDDEPVVKVLDFGIAKNLDLSLTGGKEILGTPTYMSPEQAQNHKLDGRSDLYSLGVVLYQLVSGKLPFRADTPILTLMLHINAPVPDIRAHARTPLSDAFVSLVQRALSKNPNNRFPSAKAMRDAINACVALQQVASVSTPDVEPARPGEAEPEPGTTLKTPVSQISVEVSGQVDANIDEPLKGSGGTLRYELPAPTGGIEAQASEPIVAPTLVRRPLRESAVSPTEDEAEPTAYSDRLPALWAGRKKLFVGAALILCAAAILVWMFALKSRQGASRGDAAPSMGDEPRTGTSAPAATVAEPRPPVVAPPAAPPQADTGAGRAPPEQPPVATRIEGHPVPAPAPTVPPAVTSEPPPPKAKPKVKSKAKPKVKSKAKPHEEAPKRKDGNIDKEI